MSNQIICYKETIEYILNHRNIYYPSDDMFRAINRPAEFLKVRKEVDAINEKASLMKDVARAFYKKYETTIRYSETDPTLLADVRKLLRMGEKIPAIKILRTATGLSLMESKHIVDRLEI
jgi:ribosomal protein L7/L12